MPECRGRRRTMARTSEAPVSSATRLMSRGSVSWAAAKPDLQREAEDCERRGRIDVAEIRGAGQAGREQDAGRSPALQEDTTDRYCEITRTRFR